MRHTSTQLALLPTSGLVTVGSPVRSRTPSRSAMRAEGPGQILVRQETVHQHVTNWTRKKSQGSHIKCSEARTHPCNPSGPLGVEPPVTLPRGFVPTETSVERGQRAATGRRVPLVAWVGSRGHRVDPLRVNGWLETQDAPLRGYSFAGLDRTAAEFDGWLARSAAVLSTHNSEVSMLLDLVGYGLEGPSCRR